MQSREIDRTKKVQVKEANRYFFIETCVALFVSFVINVFVVSVFASGMYQKTNREILDTCVESQNTHTNVIPVGEAKLISMLDWR